LEGWLVEVALRGIDCPALPRRDDDEAVFWQRAMTAEACRVKEALHLAESATFEVIPPEELRRLEARFRGPAPLVTLGRDDLAALLRERGWHAELASCVDLVLAAGAKQGVGADELEDVLLVGGSTLLPGVYPPLEERFGRARVRAWQPFEAVAYGACAFAADRIAPTDFIVHDYAIRTHDPATHRPEHVVIIPGGTRFPTAPDAWRGRLVPTCSLGEPESLFKLVICEVGRGGPGERRFAWDGAGRLAKVGGAAAPAEAPVVVPLNESSPALGTLDPRHAPGDRRPRLEVCFGVNAERWLCANVRDLLTGRVLMRDEPVVRLL
jgi:hypothetical protein